MARGDRDALFDWQRQVPHARRAHPSDEHFLPIFFALGAAGRGLNTAVPPATWLTREVQNSVLAMDSFARG